MQLIDGKAVAEQVKPLLSKLTAAKAQVTILENKMVDYKERMKEYLFFDEETDENIRMLKCKIENQRAKQREYEKQIKDKLKQIDQ